MKSKCANYTHVFTKQLLALIFALVLPVGSFAGGCCAGHGGVAGCNASGQQVCKDKSVSPSCKCKAKAAAVKPAKNATTAPAATPKKGGILGTGLFQSKTTTTKTSTSGRGCCSKHGGVASCNRSTGVSVCKDGTNSPTCKCQ